MITVRRSEDRGSFNFGWLETFHSFSFGEYHDPRFMGFRSLRVINEDYVQPSEGFPTHGHRDMEIITYIIKGKLEHKDNMGNGSQIVPGDVQRMSAGKGVLHSEFNGSKNEAVHLLQIWIMPAARGITPSYEQKSFSKNQKLNQLCLVAAESGSEGAVKIHQDAKIYASVLEADKKIKYEIGSNRGVWVQLIQGELDVNGFQMKPGDGLAAESEKVLNFFAITEAEFLVFDLS